MLFYIMQNNKLKDLLELFENLLSCESKDSQNLYNLIIRKIKEIKIDLNSNELEKENIIQLSKAVDKLIQSKELKQKTDFMLFEEFKNYLEKKK